jgi:carboxylesterase type B
MTDRMFRVPTEGLCVRRDPTPTAALISTSRPGDVPFAFDNLDATGIEVALGPQPPALADHMHRAWVDFVTEGDPGWPAFRLETRPAMCFDGESAGVLDPRAPSALPVGRPHGR